MYTRGYGCVLNARKELQSAYYENQSLDRLGRRGDMRDDSAEILFHSFLQEAPVGSSGMGRDVYSLMLYIQNFFLPTTASPTLQGALKDGLGEAVVACDVPILRVHLVKISFCFLRTSVWNPIPAQKERKNHALQSFALKHNLANGSELVWNNFQFPDD